MASYLSKWPCQTRCSRYHRVSLALLGSEARSAPQSHPRSPLLVDFRPLIAHTSAITGNQGLRRRSCWLLAPEWKRESTGFQLGGLIALFNPESALSSAAAKEISPIVVLSSVGRLCWNQQVIFSIKESDQTLRAWSVAFHPSEAMTNDHGPEEHRTASGTGATLLSL